MNTGKVPTAGQSKNPGAQTPLPKLDFEETLDTVMPPFVAVQPEIEDNKRDLRVLIEEKIAEKKKEIEELQREIEELQKEIEELQNELKLVDDMDPIPVAERLKDLKK